MNTPRCVVDASVVAKWILPSEHSQDNAVRLKEDCVSGIVELGAPSFIVEEVANALWRAIKLQGFLKKCLRGIKSIARQTIKLYELNWI